MEHRQQAGRHVRVKYEHQHSVHCAHRRHCQRCGLPLAPSKPANAKWCSASCRQMAYRDRKTRFYRVGIVITMIGLGLYVLSIFVMLLYPNEAPGLTSTR